MNIRFFERMKWENDLRNALEGDEFMLYFQPQIDLNTQMTICAEVLMRWKHPKQGLILPGQFINIAEETGLIIPIGKWVLRTACEQVRAWQNTGHPPMKISVNLSARQFQQPDLVEMITKVLEDTSIKYDCLELEITESVAMENIENTISTMQTLNDKGVRFSIDDFGKGYSSLNYLKRLPIQKLKIDRSFIRDVTTNPDDATIVSAVIAMAHDLRLKVIVEVLKLKNSSNS